MCRVPTLYGLKKYDQVKYTAAAENVTVIQGM